MHRIEEVSLDFRFEASTRIAQDAAICRAINKTATVEGSCKLLSSMEILFSPLFFFLPVINDNLEPANTLNIDDRVNDAEQKTGHRSKLCSSRHVLPSSFLQHSGNAEIDRIVRYRFVHVSKISLIRVWLAVAAESQGQTARAVAFPWRWFHSISGQEESSLSLSFSLWDARLYPSISFESTVLRIISNFHFLPRRRSLRRAGGSNTCPTI